MHPDQSWVFRQWRRANLWNARFQYFLYPDLIWQSESKKKLQYEGGSLHCTCLLKEKGKSECIEDDQQSSHFCSWFNLPVAESATLFILYLYYVLSVDGWSRTSHPCTRNEFGVWELTIPYKEDGSSPIPHGSKVKVSVDKWLSPVICIMSRVAKIKFLSWILQQLNLVPSLE